jgi:hypothetical protein
MAAEPTKAGLDWAPLKDQSHLQAGYQDGEQWLSIESG